jgi:hypothetical protein
VIHWHEIPTQLVELGDSAPTGAIVCLSVLALCMRRAWRNVAVLVGLSLLVVGFSLATKVAFDAWGFSFGLANFSGASGHASRAAAAYPTFGWIVFAGSSRVRRLLGVGIGVLFAWNVIMQTIETTMHTPAEAFTGALIGALVPIAFARAGELEPLPDLAQASLVAVATALCAWLPVMPWDIEGWIAGFSQHLR